MSRTTLDLPDELLRKLKERAARQGATLSRVASDLLRSALGRTSTVPRRLVLPTVSGKPRPGVQLEDRDSLFDLMNGR